MEKRTFKQKCLAIILSLAVALTFIPMTAGAAFADDESGNAITLDVSKVDAAGTGKYDESKEFYINLASPWNVNKANIDAVSANGENQIAKVDNIKVPGIGSITPEQGAYEVTYSSDNWTEPGEYTITVTGTSKAVSVIKGETTYSITITGSWTKKCKVVNPKDLAGSTIELEYTNADYDGEMHKPEVTSVVDGLGNTVDESYYMVSYPSETKNAYIKTGEFIVRIDVSEAGKAAGYTGFNETTVTINDEVTTIAIYYKNGVNGAKTPAKSYVKAKWGNFVKKTSIWWNYNQSRGYEAKETTTYIPVEDLLADAGVGEMGKFNGKDILDVATNSDPEPYFKNFTIAELQKWGYDAKGQDILAAFGGENTIPAFLVMDWTKENTPLFAVGYSDNTGSDDACPAGNMFPKPVSELTLTIMDIAKLKTTASSSVTYTGKAVAPKVTVKDGSTTVPVTVSTSSKNVGPATATVTAKSDSAYYGKKTVKYNVLPKSTTLKSVKKGTKRFTVKWNKQKTQTTGYQIRYSKKSNFSGAKYKTVKKNSTSSLTVKKLSKKTKYYVQVRTYKTVNGVKYYSSWSKAKSVKTR